mmetsp:Transcript_57781/g.179494  ORF Transcript_57781/g.179494 Transcript_57781/m.179494 type:complete len:432 (-) Transcript_57781:135-1430(-)
MAPARCPPSKSRVFLHRAAALAVGAALLHTATWALAGPRQPTLFAALPAHRQRCLTTLSAERTQWDDPYLAQAADEEDDLDESKSATPQMPANERDVQVTDIRDLNELLRLPNPMKPTAMIQLRALTLDDGSRIERPNIDDLRRLRPSKLRPVTFHWRDRSRVQTKAPKQYDEIIQRLLNAGPADMEDLVRANWQQFDRAFFFRLMELKEDAQDDLIRSKIVALEKLSMEIVSAAQSQMRKSLPEHAKDSREIIDSMLEADRSTLLWPPPGEAFARLAETITVRATRSKYADEWFESMLEIAERYAKKMEVQGKKQLYGMGLIIMQRLVTEWFRHDGLWEETAEGQFIFRLMSLTREQWLAQLFLEQSPLDTYKLRDELKIISENKVVQLPMGSKLQIYAAKYLQELVEFVEQKDELLRKKDEVQAAEAGR